MLVTDAVGDARRCLLCDGCGDVEVDVRRQMMQWGRVDGGQGA